MGVHFRHFWGGRGGYQKGRHRFYTQGCQQIQISAQNQRTLSRINATDVHLQVLLGYGPRGNQMRPSSWSCMVCLAGFKHRSKNHENIRPKTSSFDPLDGHSPAFLAPDALILGRFVSLCADFGLFLSGLSFCAFVGFRLVFVCLFACPPGPSFVCFAFCFLGLPWSSPVFPSLPRSSPVFPGLSPVFLGLPRSSSVFPGLPRSIFYFVLVFPCLLCGARVVMLLTGFIK